MADITTNLLLPYIVAAQAQKHVTHNDALRLLDGLVQLSVLDRDLAAPPGSPAEGARYIVAAGATGAWSGWSGDVALWSDGAWLRLPARTGWRVWVEDEGLLLVYDGAGWVGTTPATLQNLALLGLGTTADAVNPFSAKLNGALWTAKTVAEGGTGDLRYTMNKATPGDTASLLFQTGFSGRAEMGLAGSDAFAIKVSPDGAAWNTGLTLDAATGKVNLPLGAVVTGAITGTAVTQTTTDTTAGRLLKVGDFGLGATAVTLVTDYDALIVTGFYRNNAVATGTPIASSLFWSVLHIAHASDGTASQLALRSAGVTSNDMWLRRKSGGAWSTWAKVFHSENLLGTVSQTAGVPTGAVFERGSNANGSYTKFADGTMICYHTFSVGSIVAIGAGTFDNPYMSNPNVTWTFPAAFSAVPVVVMRPAPPAGAAAFSARRRAFTTSAAVNVIACYQIAAVRMGSDATADVFAIDVTATGRWF